MRTLLSFLLVCVLTAPSWSNGLVATTPVAAEIVVDRFDNPSSDGGIPPGWYEYRFHKTVNRTKYSIVPFELSGGGEKSTYRGDHVLKAEADCASSLIGKRMSVDLRAYPILCWRWKINGIIKGADARTKEGNDFPARIYVAVEPKEGFNPLRSLARGVAGSVAGVPVPKATIDFVWCSKYKAGEVFPSPWDKSNRIVIVESGEANAGKWVEAEVNVLEYYDEFFPGGSAHVEGIAVMSDSDNTQTQGVVAYYDDLVFRRAPKDSETAGE